MSNQMLTPKFLTKFDAVMATTYVMDSILNSVLFKGLLEGRRNYHVVVLVPSMKDDRATDYPEWPRYEITPYCIYDVGNKNDSWKHKYDDIAKCKALQLWHDRNDGGNDNVSHLIFPGDTPWSGGVKREGIVVACSGFQPWFDRMVSGMIADMVIALARNVWLESEDKKEGVDFLT